MLHNRWFMLRLVCLSKLSVHWSNYMHLWTYVSLGILCPFFSSFFLLTGCGARWSLPSRGSSNCPACNGDTEHFPSLQTCLAVQGMKTIFLQVTSANSALWCRWLSLTLQCCWDGRLLIIKTWLIDCLFYCCWLDGTHQVIKSSTDTVIRHILRLGTQA